MSAAAQVCKVARFGLTTADADALATFYEGALGFRRIAAERACGAAFERSVNVQGGAKRITLGLGREIVELLQFDRSGLPYPAGSSASDLLFQHFAIVVTDMGAAWRRLCAAGGWSAITRDAPQRLPDTSGGVTAIKFRDPEGHPLELLAFPAGNIPAKWRATTGNASSLGIDHSAISVADTGMSSAFYSALGLQVSGHSFNHGLEQDELDDVPNAQVDVTALSPNDPDPHIELLCYRCGPQAPPRMYNCNDIPATRLILEICAGQAGSQNTVPRTLLDPDAHHLTIVSPP